MLEGDKSLLKDNSKDTSYSAENIQVLEGLEPVRKRPGMYIGSTGPRGLHHLVYEIVDNSIDEAMAGFCKNIKVIFHNDNSVTVEDDGRGIPIAEHTKYKKSALTIALTMLHAGGKFDKNTYKVSGGLHGVGASVVNALSEKLVAVVKRDGKMVRQEFCRGAETTPVQIIGDSSETGTIITFHPDPQIFESIIFDYETISSRLRELAFLNKGVSILLSDERSGISDQYLYKGGIKEFVEHLNKNKQVLHPVFFVEKEKDGVIIEVALQYNTTYSEQIYSFANNINTHEGGSHLTGFRTALTRTINSYADKQKSFKSDEAKFTSDDMREGLTVVISAKVPEPQFEGQTKTKLGNSIIKGITETIFGESFTAYLEEHPHAGKAIITKCLDAFNAREAARKAKDLVRRKSLLEGSRLPGKLADCSSKNVEECELYLVEGDSAGGSCKMARKREFQAILPLKGKVINVEKARLVKVLKNEEIINMITALGTSIGEDFDAKKLRYGKIIIMTDADVDGNHITCLLLTFFYRHMKELIVQGRIYLAQPPLYKLWKGKNVVYAYDEKNRESSEKSFGEGVNIQRYKGLGEMNPEQLWETTMNPDSRTLKKITIEDAIVADELFTRLMGDDVEPRKEFIMAHAKEAVMLDV
ncbi:DNA topoisomerase (ATP-hydrolyzing) subunit B [Candidatus Woesearchaeota archaeon]|nr:DNA topoisomerase (ATP-hydrolyzing) subunit B [Candidatus Woesearchaeota archaeon]